MSHSLHCLGLFISRQPPYNQIDAFKEYDVDNIFILTDKNKSEYIQGKVKGKLIIIDRADLILDDELIDLINEDFNTNRYLIFGRKPLGISVSPNHFGTFEREGDAIHAKYLINAE